MHRILALLCVAAVAALGPAASARADGDPASDVLLAQDAFLPYAPNVVSKPVEAALADTLKRAKAKGFPMKVALIADKRDLGSVAQLIGDPQKYADLLTTELSLNATHGTEVEKPRVLTVLPTGIGGNNLGDNAGTALEGILPADGAPDELALTAAVAVGKLAAADGKAFAMPALPEASAGSGGDGGGGIPAWVMFGAPVLLLVLAVLAVNARMGKPKDAAAEEPAADAGPQPAAG